MIWRARAKRARVWGARLPLLLLWWAPATGWAQDAAVATSAPATTSSTTEAQLMATQLYTDDDLTDRHLSFTEVRGLLHSNRLFGVDHLGLIFDGRFRKGWTAETSDFADIMRAYVQVGDDSTRFRFALGRLTLSHIGAARVDGALLGARLGSVLASLFGGLSPHPFTGAVDPRFVIGGAGYDFKAPDLNHAGGAAVQLYDGGLDRLYLSERVYVLFSPEWLLFGSAVIDLVPPRGLLGDLAKKSAEEQSALERIDLTQAHLMLRYRPSRTIDFTLSANHFHTILPNRWWTDFIAEERARRGFIIDGFDPLGTRRSSARLLTNVHLGDVFTPYLSLRYDRRHLDPAQGYEVTLGLKLLPGTVSYADLSATQRRFFAAENQLLSMAVGTMVGDVLTLDAQGSAMRTRSLAGGDPILIYDFGATVGAELSGLGLAGMRAMVAYQGFLEPEIGYHVVFAQLGYRFRG